MTRDYAREIKEYGERHNLMTEDITFFQQLLVDATTRKSTANSFDKCGLKQAVERGLAIGRSTQEFDLQLLLDMLNRIEILEAADADAISVIQQWRDETDRPTDQLVAADLIIDRLQKGT
jgi:hypothetical protein